MTFKTPNTMWKIVVEPKDTSSLLIDIANMFKELVIVIDDNDIPLELVDENDNRIVFVETERDLVLEEIVTRIVVNDPIMDRRVIIQEYLINHEV